jgi:hypothetical protein
VAAAPVARADARAEIQAAYAAMVKEGRFRTVANVDGPKGPEKQTVEVVWPDRFHMTSPQVEIIIVPGATYMKQGGKWSQLPVDMGRMIERYRPDAMKSSFDSVTNVQSIGDSSINGHAAHGYEYDSSVTVQGVTAKSHAKLWVDASSGLPLRQESDGEVMGHKSHHVADYEYDSGIKIAAPM